MAEDQSDITDGSPKRSSSTSLEDDNNNNKDEESSKPSSPDNAVKPSREKHVDPEPVDKKVQVDSSSSTQADIIKNAMMGKTNNDCAVAAAVAQPGGRTKMNLGLRGGIFGASDWDSDMNLAFAGYKRSSIKEKDENEGASCLVSKAELESLADPGRGTNNDNDKRSNGDTRMSTDTRNSNGTTTSSRSSESTTASTKLRLSFWPLQGGSEVEEFVASPGDNLTTTSAITKPKSDKPSRISFWPGLEQDEEEKKQRNSSVGSDDPSTASSSRVSRISTFRKRDSRARSPRRTVVGETNGSGNNDGGGEAAAVDLELSRESWSHMRDSLNPSLLGSDGGDGGGRGRDGADIRNNQAKFIESAIKKKQTMFTPISNFFAGGSGGSDDITNQDDDDINKTLRRVTQHNKGSLERARDEICKLDMYEEDS